MLQLDAHTCRAKTCSPWQPQGNNLACTQLEAVLVHALRGAVGVGSERVRAHVVGRLRAYRPESPRRVERTRLEAWVSSVETEEARRCEAEHANGRGGIRQAEVPAGRPGVNINFLKSCYCLPLSAAESTDSPTSLPAPPLGANTQGIGSDAKRAPTADFLPLHRSPAGAPRRGRVACDCQLTSDETVAAWRALATLSVSTLTASREPSHALVGTCQRPPDHGAERQLDPRPLACCHSGCHCQLYGQQLQRQRFDAPGTPRRTWRGVGHVATRDRVSDRPCHFKKTRAIDLAAALLFLFILSFFLTVVGICVYSGPIPT